MANEQMSLDNILSEKEPEKREPAAAPETPKPEAPPEQVERAQSSRRAWEDKEQAAHGRVRDPGTGQFVKAEPEPAAATVTEPAKAEPAKEPAKTEPAKTAEPAAPAKPAAAQQPELTDKEKAFLRAAQEERGKRQELERRIAAGEFKAQPAATPAEPEKTFWDDPEAAFAKHRAEVKTEALNARLNTAEFIARQKHPDFEDKLAAFSTILQRTPGLYEQWIASPDPAEFAYSLGKNHIELQEAGSIEGLRARIEKETRIRLEAELREKAEALAKERAAIPPSLSEARASGVNKPVWGGPPSLDDIISGKD